MQASPTADLERLATVDPKRLSRPTKAADRIGKKRPRFEPGHRPRFSDLPRVALQVMSLRNTLVARGKRAGDKHNLLLFILW
jgi:hypothetical protein